MKETIFSLRFSANESIQPMAEDLRLFLESPKAAGKSGRHKDDLAPYTNLLGRVEAFERKHGQPVEQRGWQERKLLGVLAHSRFIKPSFKTALEQFKYHAHALESLDLRKPVTFIRSAEEEIGRLNPKKDQAKIDRLRELVQQRNKDLEGLRKHWAAVIKELNDIAVYIRDNLLKVSALSEAAITALVSLQIGGEKKEELVEDIKRHYRDQIRDNLQLGPVTKEYIAKLQDEVAALSQQLSKLVLEDIYSMTGIYEQIHDRTRQAADRIAPLINRIGSGQRQHLDGDKKLFAELEGVLLGVVSDLDFGSDGAAADPSQDQERILFEKRREMIDHVFDVLNKNVLPA